MLDMNGRFNESGQCLNLERCVCYDLMLIHIFCDAAQTVAAVFPSDPSLLKMRIFTGAIFDGQMRIIPSEPIPE